LTTAPRPPLPADRRLDALPLLVGFVLGGLLSVRLAIEDEVLLTRDSQLLMLLLMVAGMLTAGVLGLLGQARRARARRAERGLDALGSRRPSWPGGSAWRCWGPAWSCGAAA
jgi:hypothetical protein